MLRRNRGLIATAVFVLMLSASSLNAQAEPQQKSWTVMEMFFIGSAVVGIATWFVRSGQRMGRIESRIETLETANKSHIEEIGKIKESLEMLIRIDERMKVTQKDISEIKALLLKREA